MNQHTVARVRRWRALSLLFGVALLASGCDSTRPTSSATARHLTPDSIARVIDPGEFVHLYFHAHQDDWQLFMGDQAWLSRNNATQVVFVYVTAGDGNQPQSYWLTRERAAQVAVDTLLGTPGTFTCANQVINSHPINRCVKGKAIIYNMRLPDGGMNGEGWGGRGSLPMLRDGQSASLTALDGSTSYTSWADLTSTIRGIVDFESNHQSAPFVEVHAPDYVRANNPGNHPDHNAVGDLAFAASASRSWNLTWNVDYNIQNLPVNLTQAQHDLKQRVFYAYDNYMGSQGLGRAQYESSYQNWLWRSYYRTEVSTPAPPPATPTNLAATAASGTSVNLTWTDNATNESNYSVERAPDNAGTAGTFAVIATLGANTTSYSSTGLSATTTYWYRVRATNSSNQSGYSNSASATTLLVPAMPTNVQGTGISANQVSLTWTDNATNETGYAVEQAPDNNGVAGTFVNIATLGANATSHTATGLFGSTRYWFRIRAFNATDASSYTTPLPAVTLAPPAAPSALAVQVVSSSQINLTWTDNATNETGYTVERAPDNAGTPGTFAVIASLGANTTSYGNTGLAPATTYWYRVRAFNGGDQSNFSNQVSGTTQQVPPAAPSNLLATAITSARIDLSWTDNASNESGFQIERAPDNAGVPGAYVQVGTTSANQTSFSSTGLTDRTRYWYRVRATNSAGNSGYSNDASATTLAPPTTRYDFYFHGHQDDWQLFMGDLAYASNQIATRVIFIYATAGDGNQPQSFWSARERAAQVSVDTLLNQAGSWTCGNQTINGHPINRCVKGKAIAYSMRLPDGGMNGEGFSGRGSMSMLRDGQRSTLSALDGSTTYTSWADLTNTIRGIVDFESNNQSAPAVEVHAPDYSRVNNPGNHPDHMATADAVQAASLSRSWNLSWHVDYQIKNMPVNLTQSVHDIKQRLFYAYDNYMGSLGLGRNQFESDYQAWLWRSYYRTVTP